MRFNEFIRKSKLTRRERQVEYWIEVYNEAYPKGEVIPSDDSLELNNNDLKIKKFENKYPFYKSIVKLYLNKRKYNEEEIRIRVVEEIITYFEVVYNNKEIEVKTNNYTSISSNRTFSNEKKNILKDLDKMLFEAILYSKIKEQKTKSKLKKIKKEVETPISIEINEVYVIQSEKENSIEQIKVKKEVVTEEKKYFIDSAKNEGGVQIPKDNETKNIEAIKQEKNKIPKQTNAKKEVIIKEEQNKYSIDFKNNFRAGRNGISEHKYYSLFYSLIHKFHPNDTRLSSFNSRNIFYSEIANKYDFSRDRFGDEFPSIFADKSFNFLKENPRYLDIFIKDERLKKYENILNYIKNIKPTV